ncbi:glycerate kinase [Adhaeribacter swui]|uniref:Glycerate kinase n=1 Tax=Adhaeribacter swui TaxID=2086471 RepID=A0A7G7GE84_9BACT|nr:glycerate kinase [Adhaeribacter swui]QNF35468.1 glycerate kinase [Adhaeribacter swui]
MHVVISPNAFKHSLSGLEVANAIKAGLEESNIDATYFIFPVADGGEGMLEILVNHWQGTYRQVAVLDPLLRPITATFGLVNQGKTAVIELAQASGLKHLTSTEPDPLQASTYGTGQLVKAALDAGVQEILIGVGNSATVDGGTGLLQALGVQFYDEQDQQLPPGAASLRQLARIDLTELDSRLETCEITVVCDVDNPLLGPKGAAFVFGPQKGADEKAVVLLENALTNLAQIIQQQFNKQIAHLPHGGAAGGTAAGLAAILNAKLVPGTEYILQKTNFRELLNNADLLITAEGGLDEQTLAGKGPYGVAKLAKNLKIPVVALAGQMPVDLNLKDFHYFDAVFPIGTGPVPLTEAIAHTAVNLKRTACQVGKLLLLPVNTRKT